MTVSIASDHAGYDLRQQVVAHLKEKGFEVLDGGAPNGTDAYSYVEAGKKIAEDVLRRATSSSHQSQTASFLQ